MVVVFLILVCVGVHSKETYPNKQQGLDIWWDGAVYVLLCVLPFCVYLIIVKVTYSPEQQRICQLQGLLFGSIFQYRDRSEVELRLYICDGQIKNLPTVNKENELRRHWLDEKEIRMKNPSPLDTIELSILIGPDNTEEWKMKTKPNDECLFKNEPQRICDIVYCDSTTKKETPSLVGEWTLTTPVLHAQFLCFIDANHKPENTPATNTTFDVNIDGSHLLISTREVQTDRYIRRELVNGLDRNSARELAREMGMSENNIINISDDHQWNAKECIQHLVANLIRTTGTQFIDSLLPALVKIGRQDLKDMIKGLMNKPCTTCGKLETAV